MLAGCASREGVDTLAFWAANETQFKIWARIAAQVFATMASSTDIERLFIITIALVCAGHRSTLSPYMRRARGEEVERAVINAI